MANQPKIGLLFNHYLIPLEYGFANGMQKEYNRAEDGTVLSEKHTFNIRGAIVARGDTSYDRYKNLVIELNQQFINIDLEAGLVDRLYSLRGGPLKLGEIVVDEVDFSLYTIDPNTISLQYKYAQLINVAIAEAPEDTAGTHFQEITMSFEAIIGPADNDQPFYESAANYRLKSASENFEIKKEEDKISYFVFDTAQPNGSGKILADKSNPYYSYTITHTLSAQGMPVYFKHNSSLANRYTSSDLRTPVATENRLDAASEAFYEAYKYVNAKKKDTLIGAIVNTDAFGRSYLGGTSFIPVGWTIGGDTSDGSDPVVIRERLIARPPGSEGSDAATGTINEVNQVSGIISNILYQSGAYKEYNVVRTSTADTMGGSYSLTTTYFYSRNPATIEINGSYEKSEDGNDSIRVNGTITGLDSNGVVSDKSNKHKNARQVLDQICKHGLMSDDSNEIVSHEPSFTNKTRELNLNFNDVISDKVKKTYIDEQNLKSPSANDTKAGIDTYKFQLGTGNASSSVPAGINGTGVSSKVLSPWGVGTNIFRFANEIFEDNKYSSFYEDNMVMDVRPISTSITENKTAGTIQFDATYKAIPFELRKLKLALPDCIAVTISIQDDNKFRRFNSDNDRTSSGIRTAHIVPVMILGRTQGPILQSMATTKQSERKVQLEATLDISQRYPSNDECIEKGIEAILMYAPSGLPTSPMHQKSYLTELTDSWDWANGKLTINAGWTYTQ
jgi:hypothetical protein